MKQLTIKIYKCIDCPNYYFDNDFKVCVYNSDNHPCVDDEYKTPDWCPLPDVPDKKEESKDNYNDTMNEQKL